MCRWLTIVTAAFHRRLVIQYDYWERNVVLCNIVYRNHIYILTSSKLSWFFVVAQSEIHASYGSLLFLSLSFLSPVAAVLLKLNSEMHNDVTFSTKRNELQFTSQTKHEKNIVIVDDVSGMLLICLPLIVSRLNWFKIFGQMVWPVWNDFGGCHVAWRKAQSQWVLWVGSGVTIHESLD